MSAQPPRFPFEEYLDRYRLKAEPDAVSPSFPRWLLRRDRTLSAALTNPIFLAFEEHRRRPRTLGRNTSRLMGGALMFFVGFVFIVLFVATFLTLGCCALPLLVILAIVWNWVQKFAAGVTTSEVTLPDYLKGVFVPSINTQAFRDLWQLPAPGALVVEALILDERRSSWLAAAAPSFLLFFVGLFIWGVVLASDLGSFVASDLLAIAAALFFTVAFALMIYWELAVSALNAARDTLETSAKGNTAAHAVRRETLNVLKLILGLVLLSFLMMGMSLLIVLLGNMQMALSIVIEDKFGQAGSAGSWLAEQLELHLLRVFVALFFLIGGFLLLLIWVPIRRTGYRQRAEILYLAAGDLMDAIRIRVEGDAEVPALAHAYAAWAAGAGGRPPLRTNNPQPPLPAWQPPPGPIPPPSPPVFPKPPASTAAPPEVAPPPESKPPE